MVGSCGSGSAVVSGATSDSVPVGVVVASAVDVSTVVAVTSTGIDVGGGGMGCGGTGAGLGGAGKRWTGFEVLLVNGGGTSAFSCAQTKKACVLPLFMFSVTGRITMSLYTETQDQGSSV